MRPEPDIVKSLPISSVPLDDAPSPSMTIATALPLHPASQAPEAIIAALATAARTAQHQLGLIPGAQRDAALRAAATAVRDSQQAILDANRQDVEAGRAAGLSQALIDRLALTPDRIEGIAAGLETVADSPDPVGRILAQWQQPTGLSIQRVSVPLGVVGVIFESRPNVTADAAGLCVKAGNAVLLRGGSDSAHSSGLLVDILRGALASQGLPADAVQRLPSQDRALVGALLRAVGQVDVIVPRGGRSLVARVQEEARVPVFAHLDGICHLYIHEAADPARALALTLNAKMRRTSICGALETLLIDRSIAAAQLPSLAQALQDAGCEVRGDDAARALVPSMTPATDGDWTTEYLDAILSVKLVQGPDEAIAHINHYGSHHTDSIATEDEAIAARFLAEVDSAIVMHNTSTQFADGGEFGMGAEIGIATGRMHARGPVGADQLTTFKYVVRSAGAVRA